MKNSTNRETKYSNAYNQELIVQSSMMMKMYAFSVMKGPRKITNLFIWLISTKIQLCVEHFMGMKIKLKHSSMFASIQFT